MDKVACCSDRGKVCPSYQAKPAQHLKVRCKSPGIGDNLMALAVGEGLRAPGDELVFVGREWVKPWLELFEGVRVVDGVSGPTAFCDLASYELVRGKVPRWQFWARQFGATPTFPRLRPVSEAAHRTATPLAGRVILAPMAAHANRTWELSKWLEVERLLVAKGFRCVVLGSDPVEGFTSEAVIGATPEVVAAILSYSSCVVGNDSGLAHLAGMLGKPTVAVCSKASDPNIFGCYPTVKELGGHTLGMEAVTPDDVVCAVLSQIKMSFGEFPADRFAEIVAERDKWRVGAWLPVYAALWEAVRALQPKRVTEIGSRAGYSAWVILDASPGCSVTGIDANLDAHGGFLGAGEHAKTINPERFKLLVTDSHDLDQLPECDLLYVDGDHTLSGCLSDLVLGDVSGVKRILVDDVTNIPDVRAAVDEFLATRPNWTSRFIPSDTGIMLLEKL